ncbi:MAG: transcription antitermination factor NusB [Cyanobacteria bacterium SIG30]|nr:transcription antitermination factor NusB [Cyanobacteria bacterium SIG30]
MQARRAARELTLILFSQVEQNIEKYKNEDFEDIILKSVRTLTSNAQDELELAVSNVMKIKDFIEEYENNHTDNLKRPIDIQNIPVPIPMTSDMVGNLDELLSASEKAVSALEIAELTALSQKTDVKQYIEKIIKTFQKEKTNIDNIIDELSLGWNIDRIFKIDKNILRIAITEIAYIKEVPHKVVIDEALELAKKYSTDESPSFINGILAKVVNLHV